MSSFSLLTKTIFSQVTVQVTTPVVFDTRQGVDERFLHVTSSGLSNFENIYVWVSQDDGVSFVPYNISGVQVVLTNKNNVLKLEKDLYYGFTKDATTNPVTCICEYLSVIS